MVFNLLFSSLSQLWYVEVRISRNVSVISLEFEITRVDCIYNKDSDRRAFLTIPKQFKDSLNTFTNVWFSDVSLTFDLSPLSLLTLICLNSFNRVYILANIWWLHLIGLGSWTTRNESSTLCISLKRAHYIFREGNTFKNVLSLFWKGTAIKRK